jgi:two-component system, cell cycle sensor histidine kinase DivJ
VSARRDGEMLEIVVTDTGVGISREDLARIGRPYEQAGDADQRQAGSGLGLSLVRAFARLHGGEMTMESALGEGTTVAVRMPVLAHAEAQALGFAAEG